MRHRILVFAAVLGLFAAFTAYGQDIAITSEFGRVQPDLRGKKAGEPETPQVMGRVTDLVGRSVRAAEVRFIGIDFEETISAKTNAFGYYQTAELTPGRSYFISVSHRRYLFLIAPIEVLIGDETIEFNFEGESAR